MIPPLLRDRVFRRYWSASTVSMFGDQVSGVALPLAAVLALHAGAAQMGYLTALEWLPSLLFGLSFLGSAFFLSRIRPDEPAVGDDGGSVLAGARYIARSPLRQGGPSGLLLTGRGRRGGRRHPGRRRRWPGRARSSRPIRPRPGSPTGP